MRKTTAKIIDTAPAPEAKPERTLKQKRANAFGYCRMMLQSRVEALAKLRAQAVIGTLQNITYFAEWTAGKAIALEHEVYNAGYYLRLIERLSEAECRATTSIYRRWEDDDKYGKRDVTLTTEILLDELKKHREELGRKLMERGTWVVYSTSPWTCASQNEKGEGTKAAYEMLRHIISGVETALETEAEAREAGTESEIIPALLVELPEGRERFDRIVGLTNGEGIKHGWTLDELTALAGAK